MSQDQESSTSTEVTRGERNRNAYEFKNKYKITSVFGTGAFGVVFKCHRLSDNVIVAAKKLPKENISIWTTLDGKSVPMEIVALQKLANIEGVVTMFDFYNFGHYYMIVMESGENLITLQQHLKTEKKMDESEAKIHMKQLISTLNSCHERGITHRDIKPSNILLDPSTRKLLLIDFGNAQYVTKEPFYGIWGTKLFYPPESLQDGPSNSDNISVWSLGITLYYMIIGKLPFNSEEEIKTEDLWFYGYVTSKCKDFLRGCLNKDVRKRLKLKQLLNHPFLCQ